MCSNAAHSEVFTIHHYVIKFVSDLQQVGGFLRFSPVFSTDKTDNYDISEILLKVALNPITTLTLTIVNRLRKNRQRSVCGGDKLGLWCLTSDSIIFQWRSVLLVGEMGIS